MILLPVESTNTERISPTIELVGKVEITLQFNPKSLEITILLKKVPNATINGEERPVLNRVKRVSNEVLAKFLIDT